MGSHHAMHHSVRQHPQLSSLTHLTQCPGSHITIEGNIMQSPMASACRKMNGTVELMTSLIVYWGGATAFMVYRATPKGGVISPTSMFSTDIAPNQTGSNPKEIIAGTKMGMVRRMMAAESMKQPSISITTCMIPMMTRGCTGSARTNWAMACVAPT